MAHGLERIDWTAPWLRPWRLHGELVALRVAQGQSVCDALNAESRAEVPVRFVPADALPAGWGYERFIAERCLCPTREGPHDFFNGLAWLHFPRTKARLNALHGVQIAPPAAQGVRGSARDALTLFDENAALLRAPDALWQALVRKDWVQVFGVLRPLWEQSELTLFGHALVEKLMDPRKAMTAHVYRVHPACPGMPSLDAWLATNLDANSLAKKPFAHLPVLGVPGWWAANECADFYADPDVFRKPRSLA